VDDAEEGRFPIQAVPAEHGNVTQTVQLRQLIQHELRETV
jgi:hypothetical protein